ncbi:MAG: hypothetical protein V2B14_00855 [bacterium]
MDKSKKIFLISLLPAFLTILFVLFVLYPTFVKMDKVDKDLEKEKTEYNKDQASLDTLKENRVLFKEVKSLRKKLKNFDLEVPSKDELTVFLVDLERFAEVLNTKIISFSSSSEKDIEIEDPVQKKEDEKNTKLKKKKKKKGDEDLLPVRLLAIPLSITITGYYTDTINFVNALENYQRRISIDGVSIANHPEDKEKAKPRVLMTVDCKVYKLIINEANLDLEEKSDSDKEKDSGKDNEDNSAKKEDKK